MATKATVSVMIKLGLKIWVFAKMFLSMLYLAEHFVAQKTRFWLKATLTNITRQKC